jgi:adenylate kinase
MKTIIISGTPGTGKTSISVKICKLINADLISLNELAITNNTTVGYDDSRETYIIDEGKLVKLVKKSIKQYKSQDIDYLIIESHFSDIIPKEFIDIAIVLRCDPDTLLKRLENRNYNTRKIIENIQTEILGNCVNFLINKNLDIPVLEIDTTQKSIEEIAEIIINLIINGKNYESYKVGKIDWLEKLFQENRINDFFENGINL